MNAALTVAEVTAVVAVLLHLYVFTSESILFRRPSVQQMFEIQPGTTEAVRLWAFHQGVYNLLLALSTLAGVIALLAGASQAGLALVIAGTVSMLVAAIALVAADPRRQRLTGLLAQGLPAAIALTAVLIAAPTL